MDVSISNPLSLVALSKKSSAEHAGMPQVMASRGLVSSAAQVAGEAGEPSVEQAVSSIAGYVQSLQRDLNFDLDDSSGRVVVRVTDSLSGAVIRQIPSEDALRLAESLEAARSLLFKAEA